MRYDFHNPENVFVANFDLDVEAEDLERLFGKYGEVIGAKVWIDVRTGDSRGFGFVTMATEDAAERAVECLNGVMWRKRKLTVRPARK